jgi:hypothetical protein
VLFRDILQVPNMSLETIEAEFQPLQSQRPLDVPYVFRLLVSLDQIFTRTRVSTEDRTRLLGVPIWPVRSTSLGGAETVTLKTARAAGWLVADVDPERSWFSPPVPLLDLRAGNLFNIRYLIASLGLRRRYISTLRQMVPDIRLPVSVDDDQTAAMRARYRFFARVAMMGNEFDREERAERLQALKRVVLKTTPRFDVIPTLQHQGRVLQGNPIRGTISVTVNLHRGDNDHFEILMTETYFQNDPARAWLVANLQRILGVLEVPCAFQCIQAILLHDDPADRDDYLDRHGVPHVEDLENDDEIDWAANSAADASAGPARRARRSAAAGGTGPAVSGAAAGVVVVGPGNLGRLAEMLRAARGDGPASGVAAGPGVPGEGPGIRVFGPAQAGLGGAEGRYFDEGLQFLGENKVGQASSSANGSRSPELGSWTTTHLRGIFFPS